MMWFGIIELLAIGISAHYLSLDISAFIGGSVLVVNTFIMLLNRF